MRKLGLALGLSMTALVVACGGGGGSAGTVSAEYQITLSADKTQLPINTGHMGPGKGVEYPYTTVLHVNATVAGQPIPGGEEIFGCNLSGGLNSGALYYLDGNEDHEIEIDDGQGGKSKQLREIANAGRARTDEIYSILAIHVPNGVESYLHYGFDLMLSGHTHGGQIIIPGVLNGLYAPGQGVFPKYGGGRYDFGKQTMIISRGLSQKPLWLPRLGNPPELCFVTLKPAADKR